MIGSWNNTKLLYDQIQPVKGKTYAEWEEEMRQEKNGSVVFFKMNKVLYTQVFKNIDVMKDWSLVVRVPNAALSHSLRVFHMTVIVAIVLLIISLFGLILLSNRSAEEEREKLEYLSVHDPLTKLQNRRAFEKTYRDYLESKKVSQRKGALIFFDIDFFKQVNDGFGHAMGDRVLIEFAQHTGEIFEENGIVSRFGGDEFVLLIPVLESRERVEAQLKELRQRLSEMKFLVKPAGEIFPIHFSAGIVEVSGDAVTLDGVEKKADQALYQVKQRGRDGFAWYEGE